VVLRQYGIIGGGEKERMAWGKRVLSKLLSEISRAEVHQDWGKGGEGSAGDTYSTDVDCRKKGRQQEEEREQGMPGKPRGKGRGEVTACWGNRWFKPCR